MLSLHRDPGRLRLSTFAMWIALGLMVGGAIGGCAGVKQQRMGQSYLAAGDYDRAVEAARAAVKEDPNNPESLDLLSDAQTAAADFHFEQAQKLLADHRPGEALVKLDKSLEYMPAHPGANSTKVVADKSVLQCRELAQKAREAVGREAWEDAVLLAHEACTVDQGDAVARALFDHAKTALVSRHLAMAQSALDAGEASKALEACARAKKWAPDNAYLAQLERKAAIGASGTEGAASPAAPRTPDTQPATVASAQPNPMDAAMPIDKSAHTPDTLKDSHAGRPEPTSSEAGIVANTPSPKGEARPVGADAAAESPAPAVRGRTILTPKRPDGERVAPRLVRAAEDEADKPAGASTDEEPAVPTARVTESADASGSTPQNGRLIETQPIALEPIRTRTQQQTAKPKTGQRLITLDDGGGGRTMQGKQSAASGPTTSSRGDRSDASAGRSTSQPAGRTASGPRPVAGAITDARSRSDASVARSGASTRGLIRSESRNSERPAAETEPRQVFRGALSRGDKRHKKELTILDGISIKLKDTDGDPVDADFEIIAGKFKVKPSDVPAGAKVQLRGASGRVYVLNVIWIDDDQETVHFAVDRVD